MYIVTDVNGWLVMFLPSPWYLLGYLPATVCVTQEFMGVMIWR